MVYTIDSKSIGGDPVRVQASSPVIFFDIGHTSISVVSILITSLIHSSIIQIVIPLHIKKKMYYHTSFKEALINSKAN